jgi:hypothetical protein
MNRRSQILLGAILWTVLSFLFLWECSQKLDLTSPVTIPGAIAVTTIPPSATISLDGTATGLASPDTIKNVFPGIHLLKLSLAGFLDTTLSVNVSSDQVANVYVEMVLKTTTIIIYSNPSGAEIYYLSQLSGTTPDTFYNMLAGIYLFLLKLPGYIDYRQNLGIYWGETKTVMFDWTTLGYGTLEISSIPTRAQVLMNGQYNATTPVRFDTLEAGEYTIEFIRYGYISDIVNISLPSGRYLSVRDTLEPVTIIINSTPSGAKLYVDGDYYGLTPYTLKGVLNEGIHQVRLVRLGTEEYLESLYLSHGDSIDVKLNVLFDVLYYDDFNRPASEIAGAWSIYEDHWREWPKGDKEPYQTEAFCLALPYSAPTCGYVYEKDSLQIEPLSACTLSLHQYDNGGYLAAFANGELLPGISTLSNGSSKVSLDKFIGQKIQLSFYGCPAVYIDSVLVAGYK